MRNAADTPSDDATFALIAGVIAVIPVSHWAFARVNANGGVRSFQGFGSEVESDRRLIDEHERQRAEAANGPRIAVSLGSLAAKEYEINLLFADARVDYGILMHTRDRELGPFLSTEISVLTIALDAISEHLCELRLRPTVNFLRSTTRTRESMRSDSSKRAFYVLDRELKIVLERADLEQQPGTLTGFETGIAARLPLSRADGS